MSTRTAQFPGTALRRLSDRPWLAPAAVAVAAAAVLVTVATWDPNEAGHYPTCPFLAISGLYCPGCGSLRALHAIAHGDLGTALARNPVTVLAVPWVVWTWGRWLYRSMTGRRREWAAPPWVIWSVIAGIVAFWVLRNLPGMEWLAP